MRYISDDGKVFNTEYECCEYENNLKKQREEERMRQEKLAKEKQERYDAIIKHEKELADEIHAYEKDYGHLFTYKLPLYSFSDLNNKIVRDLIK